MFSKAMWPIRLQMSQVTYLIKIYTILEPNEVLTILNSSRIVLNWTRTLVHAVQMVCINSDTWIRTFSLLTLQVTNWESWRITQFLRTNISSISMYIVKRLKANFFYSLASLPTTALYLKLFGDHFKSLSYFIHTNRSSKLSSLVDFYNYVKQNRN